MGGRLLYWPGTGGTGGWYTFSLREPDSSSENVEDETEGRRFPTVAPTTAAATFESEFAIEW